MGELNRLRAYHQQCSDYGQQFIVHREDPSFYGASLTKQHLLQLNRQNQFNSLYNFKDSLNRRSSISSSQRKVEMIGGESISSGNPYYDRRKRYRRTANVIERKFQCFCGKAYGSEGSLNQHKKLKGHHQSFAPPM